MHPTHYCYLNGQILPFSEASVSLSDLGLLRGFGIFDYFKTVNLKPFYLESHLQRFTSSAERIGLELPLSLEEIENIIEELLFLWQKQEDCAFRLVLTAGNSENGLQADTPNFFVITEKIPITPPEHLLKGTHVLTYPHLREIPEVKTTNYLPILLQKKAMQKVNAQDLLYHQNNQVSECTRSNFFVFKGDTLITSSVGILEGITRANIIQLAKDWFKVEDRILYLEELKDISEAFKTGTNSNITPITLIDQQRVGNGEVGKHTQKLMQIWEEFKKKY